MNPFAMMPSDVFREHVAPLVGDLDLVSLALASMSHSPREAATECDSAIIFRFAQRFAHRYKELLSKACDVHDFADVFEPLPMAFPSRRVDDLVRFRLHGPDIDKLKAVSIEMEVDVKRNWQTWGTAAIEGVWIYINTPRDGNIMFHVRHKLLVVNTRPVCVLSKPAEHLITAFTKGFLGTMGTGCIGVSRGLDPDQPRRI